MTKNYFLLIQLHLRQSTNKLKEHVESTATWKYAFFSSCFSHTGQNSAAMHEADRTIQPMSSGNLSAVAACAVSNTAPNTYSSRGVEMATSQPSSAAHLWGSTQGHFVAKGYCVTLCCKPRKSRAVSTNQPNRTMFLNVYLLSLSTIDYKFHLGFGLDGKRDVPNQ